MRLIPVLFFCCSYVLSLAQLKQVSIVKRAPVSKKMVTQRTQGSTPLTLPFWDDFSFNYSKLNYANDSIWQYGQSVWVNTGMGINPPTINVATFDGIDSTGLPYNITLPLAKGVADKLVSNQVRMDLVDSLKRDSIFIFFYYQWMGNGEPPDPGDDFSLWFLNDSLQWKQVWVDTVTHHNDSIFIPVKFYLNVLDDYQHYFHSGFQFRFQNFGRLSGPFDTWNLDYVYINNGLSQYQPINKDFPDRAVATPLTSILNQYRSVPVKHLLAKRDTLLGKPSLTVMNMRSDQTKLSPQPIDYNLSLITTSRLHNSISRDSVGYDSIPAPPVYMGYPDTVFLKYLPSISSIPDDVDSVAIKVSVQIQSGDNIDKISNKGDYDTLVYKPLNFRLNDSTTTNFIFSDYYAYDDGVAEYAITLTQPGDYLAYEFDMMYNKADTLSAVDIYFPHVGDESDQILNLYVYNNVEDSTAFSSSSIMTQQDLTVSRTENDLFTRIKLDTPQVVSKKFFIGYKQNSTATIGVGLDKNTNAVGKLLYNATGIWQVSDIPGSPMIRAVFGNGTIIVTTAIEESKTFLYPNPNRGVFFLPQYVQGLKVCDVSGRPVEYTQEDALDKTQVTIKAFSPGLYIVHYFNDNQWHTGKVMVMP